jgi:hypothetical protein
MAKAFFRTWYVRAEYRFCEAFYFLRRLGGVGRILREFSNLVSKLSVDFKKFGNLLFKFGDALNIKLFFFEVKFCP